MTDRAQQSEIIAALEVIDPASFDPAREAERRIDFLARYLRESGAGGLVLGISGGVDSTCAGRLSQLACERSREQGHDARFVAVRLPYGRQVDADDAALALEFIRPDEQVEVDIAPGVDALWRDVLASGLVTDEATADYHKGNVKARARMTVQFAIAGARRSLVVGTASRSRSGGR